jgi:imidazolonepropionase
LANSYLSPAIKDESGLGSFERDDRQEGKIGWVGNAGDLPKEFALSRKGQAIDAAGKVVMPGLIDSHTHVVFAGSREYEFEQRILGLTYLEIAAKGGGILSTVEATRRASSQELFSLGKKRLDRMLAKGVTTVEGKSGYGLSLEDEIKILVMKTLNEDHLWTSSRLSWELTRFQRSFR